MLSKTITTRFAAFCGAALISIAMAAPASAVVLFSDDFNRSHPTDVGNGWGESESETNDVRVLSNKLRIRDQNPITGMAWHTVNTSGYENITLSFTLDSFFTSPGDLMWIDLSTDGGSTYATSLPAFPLVEFLPVITYTDIALLGMENDSDFTFRFRLGLIAPQLGAGQARIDNVVIKGDAIPVSEPGSLALLGLGLAGLGYARRRKVAA